MKQLTFFKWGFVLLLILNIGLLIIPRFLHPIPPGPGQGKLEARLIETVGFSESQAADFKTLAMGHHDKLQSINRQHEEILKEYFNVSPSNSDMRITLIEQIQKLDSRRLEITYNHFEDIRALCRPDQQAAFVEFRTEALQRILPSRPAPPGRPPR